MACYNADALPKQVDHDLRRRQVAEAVCRLASRQGLEAVSLRQVAAEAQVSMGLIQHYFSSKDEMLLFAFETMSERAGDRVARAMAVLGEKATTKQQLRVLLTVMVPADDDSRFEAPLWVAFLARAVVEPSLAGRLVADNETLLDFITSQLREARDRGEADPSTDPQREARLLAALADGLMVRSLVDPEQAATAIADLDYHLDRIFHVRNPRRRRTPSA